MIGLYMDTEISGVNLSGKRSSILDHFIDKINSINLAGPGYIYIEESEGREYHDGPTSHMRSVILTKLVSAVPPKIGFWKTTNAEITVQLTDGSIVPLYDSYMMENGNNDTYQSHTYASPSYQIMAELDRYAEHGRAKETYTSSIDRHYATKYKRKVTFYAQNDYEDMKALNDLMEKENKRRKDLEEQRRKIEEEIARLKAQYGDKARTEEPREDVAQLSSQIEKMFE